MNSMLTTLKHLANSIKKLENISSSSRLYKRVFNLSKEIFDIDSCSVLLRDPLTETMTVVASSNDASGTPRERLIPGHGALGRALSTGEVQMARETIGDAAGENGADDIVSEVMIPLRDNKEIVGVLKLESRTTRFTDDYLILFTLFGEQVAAAINHLGLKGRLDDRGRTLASISKATQLAALQSDADERSTAILEHVMESLKPDGCSIQLPDPDTDVLVVKTGLGYCTSFIGVRIPISRSIPGLVASTKRPSLIPDVSKTDKKISVLPDYLSEIAVPILHHEDVLGVLHLVHHQANVFDETDLLSAAIFADQLAIALSTSRLVDERAQLISGYSLLTETSGTLAGGGDFTAQLNDLLASARQALSAEHTSVLVPEPVEPYLRTFFAHVPRGTASEARISIDDSITGEAYRTALPVIVPEVSMDPRYIPGMEGAVSQIAVPLKTDGEVIGVLNVESRSRLSSRDADVLELLAVQIAMALDKAEMKSRLESWRRKLDLLNQAASSLNTAASLDELVDNILRGAIDALNLERCALLLFDDGGEDLVVWMHHGYGDIKGMRIASGEGITGTAAATGKPVLVDDIAHDPRYVDSGANGRTEMAVPLVVYGDVIGVLDTEGSRPGMYDRDDLELFTAFAMQAATAVHNTRLLGSLEEANRRLEDNVTEMVRMNTELSNYSKKVFRINESLEFQLKNLTAVHEAGKTITSSLDLDHTLNTILEMTSQIIGSTAGAIKLMDDETQEFRTRAKSGSLTDLPATSSVFEVPLKIGDKKIGIFELVLRTANGVGKSERRMVETLAAQAAIAIENARLFENTQQIYYDTLRSLARALEARDDYTRGHSERVAELSKQIADDMKLDDQAVQTIYNAALLHDIGKIGIRDKVLLAPRKLTEEEMDIIKDHSAFGNTILMPLKFLNNIREVVRHHHERWDGTGYPDGRKGNEIPLASRIISVADAFDAMTSNRPYRSSISQQVAVGKIKELSGSQFDPRVVESFLRVVG